MEHHRIKGFFSSWYGDTCIVGSSSSSFHYLCLPYLFPSLSSSFLCQIIIRNGVTLGSNGETGNKKNFELWAKDIHCVVCFSWMGMGNQTIPLHSLGVLLEGFRLVFPNIGLFEARLKVRTRDPDMTSLAPSEMVIDNRGSWAQ